MNVCFGNNLLITVSVGVKKGIRWINHVLHVN
ncbi:hypothetical protein F383_34752 [Gossypium arboreum]|uniref:Uncharacterized protein n=1 Tax=Gossypium arboreum TaxID=29729 RepID=A0A0B0PTL6_GOSAR|nr:hypothetical protein F383_34752 [Gossypium arboreum]